MVKPIRPEEVEVAFVDQYIPEAIFEAFNELISKNFRNGKAVVDQDDVMKVLTSARYGFDRHSIFENKWLDVEPSYRNSGWIVTYDKGDYTEVNAKSYFIFKENK